MSKSYTVASYLKKRLEQLGLEQMFGVAGNYTAGFLDVVLADPDSPLKISGNANELCAGYAADAYARLKGIGGLHVTYSVGAFNMVNTIAGCFVEQVPVVLINGAPTSKEDSIEKNAGVLYNHTTGYQLVDIHMFRPITAASERITNAKQAPYQIDSALTALLTEQRPVYLEVAEDTWHVECVAPEGQLSSGVDAISTASEVEEAVDATFALIQSQPKSIFWAGIELQRYGLQDEFLNLLEIVNKHHALPGKEIHFVTSSLSKSVISEDHPYFEGCVTVTKDEIRKLAGENGCLIGLGAWTTSKDTGNQNIRGHNTILACQNGAFIGAEYFAHVNLKRFIQALTQRFEHLAEQSPLNLVGVRSSRPTPPAVSPQDSSLTYDSFFDNINDWITEDDLLLADAGFSLI